MTPPKAAGPAVPAQPILPGQFPEGIDPSLSGPGGQAPGAFVNGKPVPPSGGRPLVNPLFGKIDPNKIDREKAKKFSQQGDKYYEKKDFKKAASAYRNAFQADPTDKDVILRLSEVSFENGDPMASYDYLSLYIQNNPSDVAKRGMRLQLSQLILGELEKKAKDAKPQEFQKLQAVALALVSESRADQAIFMASTSKEQLENLKKLEGELDSLHSQSTENKMKVLQGMMADLNEMSVLARMPMADPEMTKVVSREIPKIVTETFAVLARFAKADKDENISRYAPLFESYRLLGEGKLQEAMPFLEQVRSNGFKQYGGGDEAKGRDLFLKNLESAKSLEKDLKKLGDEIQSLVKENKTEEAKAKAQAADKIVGEMQRFLLTLPEGLMDAHTLLSIDEKSRQRRVNLAVVALWKEQIQAWRSSQVEEYTGTWSVAWRAIPYGVKGIFGSDSSKFDDINAETSKKMDLASDVEKRLNRGEAASVKEALEQIQAHGSDEMKAGAKEMLEDSNPLLKGLISYVSETKPNDALEETLMNGAKSFTMFSSYDKLTSSIYAIVNLYSRNPDHKKAAKDLLKEDNLPIYVREQTEEPPPPGVFSVKGQSVSGTLNAKAD